MKKGKLNLAPKFIILGMILLVSFFVIGCLSRFLKSSDCFKIKDVIIKEGMPLELSYLKGKNIFTLDLRKESGYILGLYPDYCKVKLLRVLPNRIFADCAKRIPQAYIKLYRYFSIDEEGALFNSLNQPLDLSLPVISGLETKIFGPKAGRKYRIPELVLALNIIRQIKSDKALKEYKINKIDTANLAAVSIFISSSFNPASIPPQRPMYLEVKIGQNDFKNKIIILSGIILQERGKLADIKYIDLRFKEPVIKFKDAK